MPRSRNRKVKYSSSRLLALLLGGIILVVVVLYWHSRMARSTGNTPDAPGLPLMPIKPTPKWITFGGCPPEGEGGDTELNLLKNRVDDGNYVPAEFNAVEMLPWPAGVERLPRRRWFSEDAHSVAKYEGIPLSIEGYVAACREEGPESTNCRGDDPAMRDFHLWLVASPDDDRRTSIVVEATPRVRASHPEWAIEVIQGLVHTGQKVRISGWLMLDSEHPDQVGRTRGTMWEIHPIMKIEINRNDGWTLLDNRTE